jgi:hypothetical protein
VKTLRTVLLGFMILSTLSLTVAPALALGGCGPNWHRSSVSGRCIWGGQNQAWCLRHTGREAVRMPNGTMVCYR